MHLELIVFQRSQQHRAVLEEGLSLPSCCSVRITIVGIILIFIFNLMKERLAVSYGRKPAFPDIHGYHQEHPHLHPDLSIIAHHGGHDANAAL